MSYSPYRKDLLIAGRLYKQSQRVLNDMRSTLPVSKRIAKAGKAVRKHANLLHWKKTLEYNPSLL